MQPRMIINFALWPLHIQLHSFFFEGSLRELKRNKVGFLNGFIKKKTVISAYDTDAAPKKFEDRLKKNF
jgi:hypothetical protein